MWWDDLSVESDEVQPPWESTDVGCAASRKVGMGACYRVVGDAEPTRQNLKMMRTTCRGTPNPGETLCTSHGGRTLQQISDQSGCHNQTTR